MSDTTNKDGSMNRLACVLTGIIAILAVVGCEGDSGGGGGDDDTIDAVVTVTVIDNETMKVVPGARVLFALVEDRYVTRPNQCCVYADRQSTESGADGTVKSKTFSMVRWHERDTLWLHCNASLGFDLGAEYLSGSLYVSFRTDGSKSGTIYLTRQNTGGAEVRGAMWCDTRNIRTLSRSILDPLAP